MLLSLATIVTIYAFLVCKIFGPKIWSCKTFDKFHVCQCIVKNLAQMCLFNTHVIDYLARLINQPRYTSSTHSLAKNELAPCGGEISTNRFTNFTAFLISVFKRIILLHIPFSSILNKTNKVGRLVIDLRDSA